MTKIKDILDFFESFAPVASAMDFDNCGLLVGDKQTRVTKAIVALDITSDVVSEAEKLGCELIISHHPIIFTPIKRLGTTDVPYLLASKGISAVCMHTNLDLSETFGVNVCLANAIGLKNIRKSKSGECLFLGELDTVTDIKKFAEKVKASLNCGGLRFTDVKKEIKTVSLCSGSGGSEIFSAIEENADVLLTGEIKHHEINTANSFGIDIVDIGHFRSEDVVIKPLIKKLEEQFSEVRFTKSATYNDFVKYLSD